MSDDYQVGRSERRVDACSAFQLQAMAATLGVPVPAGDSIPPLWYWMLFQHWVQPPEIGADGHPRSNGFLPMIPALPRRMAAGNEIEFLAELPIGEPIERVSTIAATQDKQGRSGALRFVTVEHCLSARGRTCVRELQHLVFRAPAEPEGEGAKPAAGAGAARGADDASTTIGVALPVARRVAVDTVMLYRYSALTGNGHRIHYDADYARDVEGYPGLVIHGPLQAILIAMLATSEALGSHRLARLATRNRGPAFLPNAPLSVEGEALDGGARLQTRDAHGRVCVQADALWVAPATASRP